MTGELGDAGLAMLISKHKIAVSQQDHNYLSGRLERPSPRIREGRNLVEIARAAIDISDGLLADLGHILEASGVGATLYLDRIPLSAAFSSCKDKIGSDRDWIDLAIAFGDDYELCFTIDAHDRHRLQESLSGTRFTCVGEITSSGGIRCLLENGDEYLPASAGYNHFTDQ